MRSGIVVLQGNLLIVCPITEYRSVNCEINRYFNQGIRICAACILIQVLLQKAQAQRCPVNDLRQFRLFVQIGFPQYREISTQSERIILHLQNPCFFNLCRKRKLCIILYSLYRKRLRSGIIDNFGGRILIRFCFDHPGRFGVGCRRQRI